MTKFINEENLTEAAKIIKQYVDENSGGDIDLSDYYTKTEADSTFLKQRIDEYTGVYEQDGIIMSAGTAPNASYMQVLRNGDISIAVTNTARHLTLRCVTNEVKLGDDTFTINGKQIATLEDALTTQETQTLINSILYPAPALTSASYFNFDNGALIGFSAEGQTAYDNGELTDIILPSSYSLVSNDSFEAGNYEFYSFEEMLEFSENVGYNFSAQADGQPIIFICNMSDLYSAKDFIDAALAAYGVLPVYLEPLPIAVDGDDYSVSSLGSYCFNNCSALTSITIPNSVTSLSAGCFRNCTSLTSITIPNSITSLSDNCFYNCASLTSITIPNSVISLGGWCFSYCASLTSITIPNSVTSLSGYCFTNCTSLTSITLPNSVTSLGNRCFQGCTSLTSVTVQSSNCTLGPNAFNDTNNCPIYVPAEALEAYKVATNWLTYADRLQAIVD